LLYRLQKLSKGDILDQESIKSFLPVLYLHLVRCHALCNGYHAGRSTPPYKIICSLIGQLPITKHQTRQKCVKKMSKNCLGVDVTARSTVIHHSQNGFIKGRSIFDAVRTIDDLLELAKITNKSGILVAIDFEKAFDSLDHTYLLKVLENFNFGSYFLQWIKTFYANISSYVFNNGFTTDLFYGRRGVRQGDP
jgi:hypothetical protein